MKARPFDPLRLDVEAFAKDAATLQGEWPVSELERLAGLAHAEAPPREDHAAAWRAEGAQRPVKGGAPETWLHVTARARLALVCQRCLGPVDTALEARRSFLFVADEDTAERLDAETEDDVLVLTRALDLRALVEDELLLAVPIVPRHELCPQPLPMEHGDDAAPEAERANPFAALAALKRQGSPN